MSDDRSAYGVLDDGRPPVLPPGASGPVDVALRTVRPTDGNVL